jgi:hypothetical protein
MAIARATLPLVFLALTPWVVLAAGVVGTGTQASCTETTLNAALAGGGLVTFDCGAAHHSITVTSEKTISADTEIDGGGLITLSGGTTTRILSVDDGVALTVRRLTLSGGFDGSAPGQGGAIRCGGCNLAVYDSTFDDNHVDAMQTEGGAIWFGPATFGGDSGSLLVVRSTFSDNSATSAWSYGGALFVENTVSTAYLIACTFAGNSAGGDFIGEGSAIRKAGDEDLVLVNCTLSGNGAAVSSGVSLHVGGGEVVLINTIVANSVASANCGGNGTITDGGNNLQFGGNLASSCGATIPTPLADPLGGNGLADNGGLVGTIALPVGSAAINTGDADTCDDPLPQGPEGDDERGWAHVGTCDIGAFEFGAQAPQQAGEAIPALGGLGLLLLALALGIASALLLRRT